jgi:hypothetical protein
MQHLYGPHARILLRIGAGFLLGEGAGEAWAGNPDVVFITAGLITVAVEALYEYAKRKGWPT